MKAGKSSATVTVFSSDATNSLAAEKVVSSVAMPRINRIVNAADLRPAIAPGGLISVFGQELSPVNVATKEIPLPTALGESCLACHGNGAMFSVDTVHARVN